MLTMFNNSSKESSLETTATTQRNQNKKPKESSFHAGGSKKSVHRILPEDAVFFMDMYDEPAQSPMKSRP
jgi:hypothetical protein